MRIAGFVTLIIAAALAAGCSGGGSSSGGSASTTATVSGVTTDTLMYSKTAHITVNGQNLSGGITLVSSGCSNIALLSGGTTTQLAYTCQPVVSGAMTITVKSSDGSTLSTISPTVPVPQVTMNTTMGQMVLELYPNNAPITVANFMQYVASGFYSNLIFHRVVPGFVIQGGGFNSSLQQAATSAPITLEMPNGLSNIRGSVAMARTSVLNSATSQFFINLVDNSTNLDSAGGGYAVFGNVVTGMSVADQIALISTYTINGMSNVPASPIIISSMTQTQ